jgi:phospholipase C
LRPQDQAHPGAVRRGDGKESVDYIPHHAWFQFYQSTANLMHLRPNSLTDIGHSKLADGTTSEPANHNYDSHDFFDALAVGNLPAVSFLKAPAYQDGHGQYSNPIDEQSFIISVVNTLQKSPFWSSTAVILAYDDSDGWYDHQAPPILSQSSSPADQLNGNGSCTSAGAGAMQGKSVVTLLRDPVEDALGLPGGPYEIPLFLFDRYLGPAGAAGAAHAGDARPR